LIFKAWDEGDRLAALTAYDILDTPTEPEFDDIANLAAAIFDAPIGVVNLIADSRQWFKAEVGIGTRELPLEVSICRHAILEDDLMVVPDTRLDARFVNNPLVTVEGGLRFYAGARLLTPDGLPLGTVCVLDTVARPGPITTRQRLALEVLARQVMTQLELRKAVREQGERRIEIETAAGALRESEERYKSLFNSLETGFCIIEVAFTADGLARDYRFIEVNPAFTSQTGLADAADRWMRDLAPDHEQHWFDLYGKVATTGESIRFESPAAALGQRWYDVQAFRVGPPEARRVAILFNDVTDRRRAELALKELNATLDMRIETALAERANAEEALLQARKMEAIGQLTGGVAHDFNNLLTVITGSAELLRKPDLTEERRKRFIDAISETAGRATVLTRQLLAFARRQTLSPEAFDLGASLEGVTSMIETLAGSEVVLLVSVPEEPCFVMADPSQFDTAVVNLVVNARDAMNGDGRIVISAGPVSGIPAHRGHPPVAGDFIAIAVSDTGHGIAQQDIDRIFEPFFTTKAVGVGTGLGLSQVIGFAKQSHGEIRVESVLGEGATFTLYLPRSYPEAAATARDQARPMPVNGKGVCVLVVEDNERVGDFATQALIELGFDTVLARDAEEALDLLAQDPHRFHIVFSDVVMPGMDGIELSREIRRLYPATPVVLASGYSHVLSQSGAPGFELLQKPYSIEQLSQALANARGRQTETVLPGC